jgi:hypothetical protein
VTQRRPDRYRVTRAAPFFARPTPLIVRAIQSACDYVKAAAAWLSGQTPPKHEDNEKTDDVVARLNKAIVAAVRAPDVRERLIGFGLNPTRTSPAALGAMQKADAAKWAPVVKASGFMAD